MPTERPITLQRKKNPLGGISLRWSHHTNLVGYGADHASALESLKSVFSWEKLPFPQKFIQAPDIVEIK